MLKQHAEEFIGLGQRLLDATAHFSLIKDEEKPERIKELNGWLRSDLKNLLKVCVDIDLPIAASLLTPRIDELPKSEGEFQVLIDAVMAELKSKLFLFIPSHVAQYYEWDAIVSETAKVAFPSAYSEVREAGNCLAAGLNTAVVFHSMRAAEIGVRVLGTALGVSFPNHPIELAEWQPIIEQAESKIAAMKALPKGTHKDEELNFYSQAAVQFRYFKDGWRVRVAHARATYSEGQAKEVIDHVRSFFEALAIRLKE